MCLAWDADEKVNWERLFRVVYTYWRVSEGKAIRFGVGFGVGFVSGFCM